MMKETCLNLNPENTLGAFSAESFCFAELGYKLAQPVWNLAKWQQR